jgi:hypothetical protein
MNKKAKREAHKMNNNAAHDRTSLEKSSMLLPDNAHELKNHRERTIRAHY